MSQSVAPCSDPEAVVWLYVSPGSRRVLRSFSALLVPAPPSIWRCRPCARRGGRALPGQAHVTLRLPAALPESAPSGRYLFQLCHAAHGLGQSVVLPSPTWVPVAPPFGLCLVAPNAHSMLAEPTS